MDDLIEFPPFELPIDVVSVRICEWEGMLDEFGALTEAWVQIEGIPLCGVPGKSLPRSLHVLVSLWMWTGMVFSRASMRLFESKLPAQIPGRFLLRD